MTSWVYARSLYDALALLTSGVSASLWAVRVPTTLTR